MPSFQRYLSTCALRCAARANHSALVWGVSVERDGCAGPEPPLSTRRAAADRAAGSRPQARGGRQKHLADGRGNVHLVLVQQRVEVDGGPGRTLSLEAVGAEDVGEVRRLGLGRHAEALGTVAAEPGLVVEARLAHPDGCGTP
ncbi:hypothetical protein L1887_59659 [Cichorium endivia]|nr:hypothetical protein L1887_59659 [Cichorium endivia]